MSKHKIRFFHPLSHFFLTGKKKKCSIYCSLLSSPRRLSAQHLSMGGKHRLMETAEEEVVEKKWSSKRRGK